MKPSLSPVRGMLIFLFFALSLLLTGVRLQRDEPVRESVAGTAARNAVEMFRADGAEWHELAARRPLFVLRLLSRR